MLTKGESYEIEIEKKAKFKVSDKIQCLQTLNKNQFPDTKLNDNQ